MFTRCMAINAGKGYRYVEIADMEKEDGGREEMMKMKREVLTYRMYFFHGGMQPVS